MVGVAVLFEGNLYSLCYLKGRKMKIPKQSFPVNRKEPKEGNFLLFCLSCKGMRMFSEEVFASSLSPLSSMSERCVHAHSHLRECFWSHTIHWKLLHYQSMFFLWSAFQCHPKRHWIEFNCHTGPASIQFNIMLVCFFAKRKNTENSAQLFGIKQINT